MIKLITATKINKEGTEVDNSLYLIREDANNLALKRGNRILGHYGCVRTALNRSLDFAIKGSEEELTLGFIAQMISELDESIKAAGSL